MCLLKDKEYALVHGMYGKAKTKGSPLIGFAKYFDMAIMYLHDLLYNGKSKTHPFFFLPHLGLAVTFKDQRLIFLGNARP